MNLIWFLLKASGINVFIAGFVGVLSGLTSTALLALVNDALGTNQYSHIIWGFWGLILLSLFTSILSRYLLLSLSQSAIHRLRLRLSSSILSAPLRQLEEMGANKLMATLTEDVGAIGNAAFSLPFICIDLVLIIGCLAYLYWLSWQVFWIVLGFLIISIALAQFLITKGYKIFNAVREENDRLFSHFRAITDGIKELKLNSPRRTAFFQDELTTSSLTLKNYTIKSFSLFAITIALGDFLFFLVLGFVVFILPQILPVTTSILSGYVLTIIYLARPLQAMLEILPGLSQASVALQKVETLGLSLASNQEETSPTTAAPFFQKVELRGITHTYHREREDNNFILGPIDLVLHSQELIFIVGGNGSGKSTLGKLLSGLYIPEAGNIYLDGLMITETNRESYRQLFTAIFSDFYLFEKLLGIQEENLDLHAKKYLEALQIDHKVQVKDGVLSTTELSQGQRKRLALLTAYLEDRPIYLFDEWAADQDPIFREIFYQQLLPELKNRGKAVIVISHDDRYFHLADQLIKLDYGQLARI
jgi:putative pyoverdin transport system ATP-binding/permease protein